MRVQPKEDTVYKTNCHDAEKVEFRIGDTEKIIHILRSGLYSRPIQTCVQEYLSNARDAMREAGRADRPIVVTLPTLADSRISIRDFGVGLSQERIKNIFTSYGTSSKDQSDEETGGFGLGAKSAWAYTDSFIVVSYLDGKKRSFLAHTGLSSAGTLELIDEQDTGEENGTEVQIGLRSKDDMKHFIDAAFRATMFWKVRPVFKGLLAEELPDYYTNLRPTLQGEGWMLFENNALSGHFPHKDDQSLGIVFAIDEIPYVLDRAQASDLIEVIDFSNSMRSGGIVVLSVANGSLIVNASRESLSDHESNKTAIAATCRKTHRALARVVAQEISSSQTVPELISRFFTADERVKVISLIKDASIRIEDLTYRIVTGEGYRYGMSPYDLEISKGDGTSYPVLNGFYLVSSNRLKQRDGLKRIPLMTKRKLSEYVLAFSAAQGNNRWKSRARTAMTEMGLTGYRDILCVISPNAPGRGFIGEDEASEQRFARLVRDLGVDDLTSYQARVATGSGRYVTVSSKKTEHVKGEVCLHVAESAIGRQFGVILTSKRLMPEHIEQSKTRHYYFPLESGSPASEVRANLGPLTSYLTAHGHVVCGVSPRVQAKIAHYPNVFSLVEYQAQFQAENLLTPEEMAYIDWVFYPDASSSLCDFIVAVGEQNIPDPKITEHFVEKKRRKAILAETYKKKGRWCPDHLKGAIEELAPYIKTQKLKKAHWEKRLERQEAELKRAYPLVYLMRSALRYQSSDERKMYKEILTYVSAKAGKLAEEPVKSA